MKIDWIKSIIIILLCALVSYGYFAICDVKELRWLLTIVSFITIAVTGIMSAGASLKAERTGVMFKVFSGIACAVFVIVNLIFSFLDFIVPFYIILNGILLLIYALAAVSIGRVKE